MITAVQLVSDMTDTLREEIDAACALDNESRAGFAQLKTKQAEAVPDIVEQPIAQPTDELRKLIRAEVEAERQFMIEVVAEALDKERQAVKNDLADEVRCLKLELTEMQTTLTELRAVLAAERSRTIDLPDPLRPRHDLQ